MDKKYVKVLIVDDDDDMRSFLNQILVRNGFIVEEAGDTEEGLKKVLRDKPDIILLDGNRPQLDGLEMFRLLRSNPETSDIPVILCTASCNVEPVRDVEANKGNYLEKPFKCTELYDKINNILDQKEKGDK